MDISPSTVQRWEKQGAKPTSPAHRELTRLFQEAGIDSDRDIETEQMHGNNAREKLVEKN